MMVGTRSLVGLLVAVLVLAGCSGSDTPDVAPQEDGEPLPPGGPLSGLVVDDEELPVEGALVRVQGSEVSNTTGAIGAFEFDYLPLGVHTVTVTKLGYINLAKKVSIESTAFNEAKFILRELVIEKPTQKTSIYEGRLTCQAASTNPCAVVNIATELARLDNPTNENNLWRWNWNSTADFPASQVIEIEWTATVETAKSLSISYFKSDGLSEYHEIYGSGDGGDASVVRIETTLADLMKAEEAIPNEPYGLRLFATETGAVFYQSYTIYRTDFFVEPHEEGWSYLDEDA